MKIKKSLALGRLPFIIVVLYIFDVFKPDMQPHTGLLTIDLQSGLKEQSGGSFLKQLFWIGSLCLTFLLCHLERVQISYNPKIMKVLFILLLITFFSVAWSEHPFITFKRASLQLIFILTLYFSCLLLKTRNNLFETLYISFCIILLFEMFFLLFLNHISFAYSGEFRGIHYGKNTLGVVAFTGFMISLDQYFKAKEKKKPRYLKLTLITTFLWGSILLLAQSKTCLSIAFICFFTYVSKYYAAFLFKITRGIAKKLAIVMLLLLIASFLVFNDFSSIYKQVFNSTDLTGRGVIWSLALDAIQSHPWLGSGYGAFWGVGYVPDVFNLEFSFLSYLNQAHNGYIDICLQLGLLGLFVFLFLVYTMAIELRKVKESIKILWCLFLFTLLHNITESSFLRDVSFGWFLFVIIIMSVNFRESYE